MPANSSRTSPPLSEPITPSTFSLSRFPRPHNLTTAQRTILHFQQWPGHPRSLREDISHSESFRSEYDLMVDSVLTLNGLGLSFRSSRLFPAIRTLFKGPDRSVLVK